MHRSSNVPYQRINVRSVAIHRYDRLAGPVSGRRTGRSLEGRAGQYCGRRLDRAVPIDGELPGERCGQHGYWLTHDTIVQPDYITAEQTETGISPTLHPVTPT